MTTEESAVAAKLFKAIDDAITHQPTLVSSAIQTYEEFLRAIELKHRVEKGKDHPTVLLYTSQKEESQS